MSMIEGIAVLRCYFKLGYFGLFQVDELVE